VTQRIFPMIAYEDTASAIDWLTSAFGFKERGQRYIMEDGTIGHAELELDGEVVTLATRIGTTRRRSGTGRTATLPAAGSTTPG